jgi:ribosome-associated protein
VTTLFIHSEHITLAQALKMAGLAQTGGQAKLLVREGEILVNGETALQPGRKLHPGDRFCLRNETEWTVAGPAPSDDPDARDG